MDGFQNNMAELFSLMSYVPFEGFIQGRSKDKVMLAGRVVPGQTVVLTLHQAVTFNSYHIQTFNDPETEGF